MHGSRMADNPTPGTGTKQDPPRRKPGTWPPGVSGNPKGRAPTPPELREYARGYGIQCIDGLWNIARNPKMPPGARVRAYEALAARGYGQPTQPLEHAGADGGALTVVIRREGGPKP